MKICFVSSKRQAKHPSAGKWHDKKARRKSRCLSPAGVRASDWLPRRASFAKDGVAFENELIVCSIRSNFRQRFTNVVCFDQTSQVSRQSVRLNQRARSKIRAAI